MSPLSLDGADRVPVERGDVVVLVPIYSAHDRFVESCAAFLAHTPLRVRKRRIGVRYGYYEDWISVVLTAASGPFVRAIGAVGDRFEGCPPGSTLVAWARR